MSILYINTQGACLRHSGGRFVVTQGDEELTSQPEASVDSVVLMGYAQVTTHAAHALLDAGVPLVYLTRNGRFKGMLQPGYPRNMFVRLAQYEASMDAGFSLGMARAVVERKLAESTETLKGWRQQKWLTKNKPSEVIRKALADVANADSVERVRGVEANAARVYFDALGEALPPGFVWNGRNRQPPRDPVNALLSLTYMMMTSECVSACYPAGLDPFIGFLHQLDYGRPSLALDLLEPFRPAVCDRFVMRLLHTEVVHPEDFVLTEENGCRLKPERFKVYIENYAEYVHGEREAQRGRAVPALARQVAEAIRERKGGVREEPAKSATTEGD